MTVTDRGTDPPCCAAAACSFLYSSESAFCTSDSSTVTPALAATLSWIWNLMSQPSTKLLSCCGVAVTRYGWRSDCRFDTWVLSDDAVIRSLPTIAAEPILTGEHAASIAHAPAAATTAARRDFLPRTGGSLRANETS